MSRTLKIQLLLVLAGVFVATLIYFAPRSESEDSQLVATNVEDNHEGHNHAEGESHDHEADLKNSLSESDQKIIAELEEKARNEKNGIAKLNLYDSLIGFSISRNIPPKVAAYSEEKAEAFPTEENYLLAGDNFMKAFRLSKEKSKDLLNGALRNYEKVKEINPENLDAETAIGVVNVEGSAQLGVMPMKGIGILRGVLNKDPKNVNALTNLGYFAIQSGQYEKAVERFETVLSIDSTNAEAYIYLTDIYLSQDKVEEGIKTLEKYKTLVNDPLIKKQVDDYISDIKNKNNS